MIWRSRMIGMPEMQAIRSRAIHEKSGYRIPAKVSTNFPGGKKSGVTISMIRFNQAKGELKFKVTIK